MVVSPDDVHVSNASNGSSKSYVRSLLKKIRHCYALELLSESLSREQALSLARLPAHTAALAKQLELGEKNAKNGSISKDDHDGPGSMEALLNAERQAAREMANARLKTKQTLASRQGDARTSSGGVTPNRSRANDISIDRVRADIANAASAHDITRAIQTHNTPVEALAFALNALVRRKQRGDGQASTAAANVLDMLCSRADEINQPRSMTGVLGDAVKLVAGDEKPPPTCLSRILDAATRQAPSLDPRGVASALWAVGRLHEACGVSTPPRAGTLLRALEATLSDIAPRFNARDVSAALWGLAKARARPAEVKCRAAALTAVEQVAKELASMPQELSMTSWALATLTPEWIGGDGLSDDARLASLYASAAGALERAILKCAMSMMEQALATCLWAISRFHRSGDLPGVAREAAEAVHAQALKLLTSFDSRQIAMLSAASARLGVAVTPLLLNERCTRGSTSLMDISDMLWAAGMVKCDNRACVDRLLSVAAISIEQGGDAALDWQAFGRVEYAMRSLDVASRDELRRIRKAIGRRARDMLEAAAESTRSGLQRVKNLSKRDDDIDASTVELVEVAIPRLGGTPDKAPLKRSNWRAMRGLFAGGKPDAMTVMLIGALPDRPPRESSVLDLGCGGGAVAAALAHAGRKRGVRVLACDIDERAVNAASLNVPDATVLRGDVFDALEGKISRGQLSWVVTNPPVHTLGVSDFAVVRRVLEGAPQWLSPDGGLLFVVVQTYVPFENMAENWCPKMKLKCLACDGQFTVWRLKNKSRKRKSSSSSS
ncbi:MTS domain-containing protein [Pycnococcus provasolii]